MLETLRSIQGTHFLIIYPLLVIASVLLGRYLINRGGSGVRIPDPSSCSPAAVAVLRGGWELVLKTVVFGMSQRGVIEVVQTPVDEHITNGIVGVYGALSSKNKTGKIVRRTKGGAAPSDRVENAVWHALKKERLPEDLFKDQTLRSFVETFVCHTEQDFMQKGLMRSPGQRRMSLIIVLAISVAVVGLGAAKFCLGLFHHRPSMYLGLMLAASIIVMAIVFKPGERLTPAGREFLKKLEAHFEWLKGALKGNDKPGIDPAYAFAIFGTMVLAGTLLYSSFSEAFPGKTPGGCGGGSCGGSGCSGGTGDGGSSDSGGGSGCGGCGGGGCGGGD